MAKFGSNSRQKLDTCHVDIRNVLDRVISLLPWTDPVSGIAIDDITVIEGYRGIVRQNYLFDTHKSKVRYPNSNHNYDPSHAVDVAVYHSDRPHIHWSNRDEFVALASLIVMTAESMGIELRSGTDWDRDGVRVDLDPNESFFDGPHIEKVKT